MIKAVLFDMDGVLIDAKEWHYEALNRALNLFGMPISRYDHLTTFDGLPTLRKLEMLTMEKGLPRELHNFINEMKQIYTMEMVNTKCKPCFVHEYALSSLKNLGYKIAVCSNSIRASIEVMMSKAALAPYIDLIVSNEDVAKAKPAPDMYLKAINFFNLRPDECLVIEDNDKGIKAAISAGAHVIQVGSVTDVNLANVISKIELISKGLEV